MEIIDVTLLVLRCSDLARSRIFYERLGLQFTVEKHGSGPEHYSTRVGSLVLELYPRTDAETRGLRMGFSVKDLRATLDVMNHHGFLPSRTALNESPPNAVFRDPDGHWLELTELVRDFRGAS